MVIIVNYHVGAARNLVCGTKYVYYSDAIVVSNKAKGRISKWMFLENKTRQIFRYANISYPLIDTRCVRIRG